MRAPVLINPKTNLMEGYELFQKIKAKVKAWKTSIVTSAVAVMAVAALPVAAFASPPPSSAIDFTASGSPTIAVTDVVKTGWNFMNMFGPYTMLILGVIFAIFGISFIIWLWGKLPKMKTKS